MKKHAGDDHLAPCPICSQAGRLIHSTEFSQRAALPTHVGVYVCTSCSFGFNFPRPKEAYEQYYAQYQNDQLSQNWQISESEMKRYQGQISVLSTYLSCSRVLRVLDFGCGEGGLLHIMALGYGQHRYFGCDANALTHMREDGVSFHRSLTELNGLYDVIVLSHVVEHLVDFDVLKKISELLTQTGVVYMEVPDAGAYECYPRREFLYYFDRLHVNHFTSQSLVKIVDAYGLAPRKLGAQSFGYKDGNLFPAVYGVFSREVTIPDIPSVIDLNSSFCRYVADENVRLKTVYETLRNEHQIVAYGFGDNFFRSFGLDGPFADVPLVAVVDQRATELSKENKWLGRFNFLDTETASARFPDAMWVITVSWGGEAIAQVLQEQGVPQTRMLFL